MSNHLNAANALLERRRPKEAEQVIREHLRGAPGDAYAHSLLALCQLYQGQAQAAQDSARHAVSLAPDSGYVHFVLAHTLTESDPRSAMNAIKEALRLNPFDSRFHSIQARLYLYQKENQQALEAADAALRLTPNDVGALNLRARALLGLGRNEEARTVLDRALERDPEDFMNHVTQGYASLQAAEPQKAMEHFREALRLQPNAEPARDGIVAALRARNPVFRWLVYAVRWLSHLTPQQRRIFNIGLAGAWLVGVRILNSAPNTAPIIIPLMVLYIAFWLLTLVGTPIFDLIVRLDPIGKHALPPDALQAANAVGICLVGAVVLFGAGLTQTGELQEALFIAAAQAMALMVPVVPIFEPALKPVRPLLILYVIGLAGWIVFSLVHVVQGGSAQDGLLIFMIAWVLNSVLVRYLHKQALERARLARAPVLRGDQAPRDASW